MRNFFDVLYHQKDKSTGISFSKKEQQYFCTVANSWPFKSLRSKRIIDLEPRSLHGLESYAFADKMYDFCRRLLLLQEARTDNPIDMHYCYLSWIELLYRQIDDINNLNLCEEYCKKDIELWKNIRTDDFFRDKKTYVPSFHRLEHIYEITGRYSEAIDLLEYSINDSMQKYNESWIKKYKKLKETENSTT